MTNYPAPGSQMGWRGNATSFNGVQSTPTNTGGGMTAGGLGSTIGKWGGALMGMGMGGPLGAFAGYNLGKMAGGGVFSGLSSLFGPHGIPALFNSGGQQQQTPANGLSGLSMLTGGLGGQQQGVTQSAGGWNIDANGNLVDPGTATAGTPGYGRFTSLMGSNRGAGAYASNVTGNTRARNII